MKKALFICGCPRSGTTALWHLLSAHEDIVIGVERYAAMMLKRNWGTLNSQHYLKERFFEVMDGDTHYSDLKEFHEFQGHYELAYQRYDNATYYGDKIPELYNDFEGFSERFPDAKVLFISRNLYDVCLSYNRRLNLDTDSWERTISDAVADWNKSHDQFRKYVNKEFQGRVVEFEDIFRTGEGSTEVLNAIFSFLGLEVTDAVVDEYNKIIENTIGLEDRRRSEGFTSLEKRFICKQGSFGAYVDVTDKYAVAPVRCF